MSKEQIEKIVKDVTENQYNNLCEVINKKLDKTTKNVNKVLYLFIAFALGAVGWITNVSIGVHSVKAEVEKASYTVEREIDKVRLTINDVRELKSNDSLQSIYIKEFNSYMQSVIKLNEVAKKLNGELVTRSNNQEKELTELVSKL